MSSHKQTGNLTKGKLMTKLFDHFTDTEIMDLKIFGLDEIGFIRDMRKLTNGINKKYNL